MTQATTFNLAKALYHVKNAVIYFEAIQDKLVNLKEAQRWDVETYIDSLLTTSPKP